MIVKIQKAGSSFKGLTAYLTDQKERVAWTHSLNCANDDVLSVVHELYSTYSQAEFLKEQAGVHAGGTVVDKPVKHISLNWHPDEQPTREEMIAAAEDFLKRMGWDDHQALLVAHSDKQHRHVHIELNRINPETGRALNDNFERRRASDWALEYEREHGQIYCEDRLRDYAERTPAPSRETWQQLREAEGKYLRDELASYERMEEKHFQREDRDDLVRSREWELLKGRQREERETFFKDGKEEFRDVRRCVYEVVREEMRPEWGYLYEDRREGRISQEEFENTRAGLVAWQRGKFEAALESAYEDLREQREGQYRDLLLEQKQERHELHRRQDEGERSYELLDRSYPVEPEMVRDSLLAANENEKDAEPVERVQEQAGGATQENTAGMRGAEAIGDLGLGLIGGVATLVERLFDGFLDGRPEKKEKPAPPPDHEQAREREAARMQRIETAIEAARGERQQQRADGYWLERGRRRD